MALISVKNLISLLEQLNILEAGRLSTLLIGNKSVTIACLF